jgi:hypothetical protein
LDDFEVERVMGIEPKWPAWKAIPSRSHHADPSKATSKMALFYRVIVDVPNWGHYFATAGNFGQLIPLLFP